MSREAARRRILAEVGAEPSVGQAPDVMSPVSRCRPAGFSLIELLLVLAVTLMITSLLLPALGNLRENAHRLICSSNLRQVGLAMVMFADDHDGSLAPSEYGKPDGNKQEMMAAHRGRRPENWEGLGWLYKGLYCDAPEVFYCPSHTGQHPYERYKDLYWLYKWGETARPSIYTNYHYAGDIDWETGVRRSLARDPSLVIATDGLRTLRDFNHRTGANVLSGDTSVYWREDASTRQVALLLAGSRADGGDMPPDYKKIWKLLIKHK